MQEMSSNKNTIQHIHVITLDVEWYMRRYHLLSFCSQLSHIHEAIHARARNSIPFISVAFVNISCIAVHISIPPVRDSLLFCVCEKNRTSQQFALNARVHSTVLFIFIFSSIYS